jgi:hypothetical protein
MNREVHVRVCERLRGRFPWSTRLWILWYEIFKVNKHILDKLLTSSTLFY